MLRLRGFYQNKINALGTLYKGFSRDLLSVLLSAISSSWVIVVMFKITKPSSCIIFMIVLLLVIAAEFVHKSNLAIWHKAAYKLQLLLKFCQYKQRLRLESQKYFVLAALCSDLAFERPVALIVLVVTIVAEAIIDIVTAIMRIHSVIYANNLSIICRALLVLVIITMLRLIWHWSIPWIPFIIADITAMIAAFYSQHLGRKNIFLFPIIIGCTASFVHEVL